MHSSLVRKGPDFWVPGRKPVGPVEIDWDDPIADGLELYVLIRDGQVRPVYQRAGKRLDFTLSGNAGIGVAKNGRALTSDVNDTAACLHATGAGLDFDMPQARGTVAMGTVPWWAANDGVAHGFFIASASGTYPVGPAINMLKQSDNRLHFGWMNNDDNRPSVAVSSDWWTPGETVSLGFWWDQASPDETFNLFVKGVRRHTTQLAFTPGSTGGGSDAGKSIKIGADPFSTPNRSFFSATAQRSAIDWFAVWSDRKPDWVFSELQWNPYRLLRRAGDAPRRSLKAAAGGTVTADRTMPVGWNADLRRTVVLNVEEVLALTRESSVRAGWTAFLIREGILPVDFDGSDEEAAVLLHRGFSRMTLIGIPGRALVLTQSPGSFSFVTPPYRTVLHDGESRAVAFAAESRRVNHAKDPSRKVSHQAENRIVRWPREDRHELIDDNPAT